MIELKHVTKKYGKITAVNDVSLKIEKQETIAVVGPSGSGKTTVLRLIAGLEKSDSGEILINGQKSTYNGKIIIAPHKRGLGMIFQDLALWPHMTVMENLEFGLKCRGIKKSQREEKIDNILNIIKLNGYLNRYPYSLSQGEKQRVALARTIILEPEILLMDEPLSSLDTVLKTEILDMIINLVKKLKMTLVYVTHDREETFAIADKVVIMTNGCIVQSGKINEVSENPKTNFVKKFMRRI